MNPKIIEAASNALGYELDDERVADAIAVHEDTDTRELKHQLRKKRAEFDAAGNHASTWPMKSTTCGSRWRRGRSPVEIAGDERARNHDTTRYGHGYWRIQCPYEMG